MTTRSYQHTHTHAHTLALIHTTRYTDCAYASNSHMHMFISIIYKYIHTLMYAHIRKHTHVMTHPNSYKARLLVKTGPRRCVLVLDTRVCVHGYLQHSHLSTHPCLPSYHSTHTLPLSLSPAIHWLPCTHPVVQPFTDFLALTHSPYLHSPSGTTIH